MKTKTEFDINKLIRPNIKNLKPYQSAREELKDAKSILLDANENPFPIGYNRYPDPFQRGLKNEISKRKGISVENVFLGNGSDEIIDLLIRTFCEPGKDSVLINIPTYGMYEVCASINNVKVIKVKLDESFQLDLKALYTRLQNTKIIFVCSPNNPTGNLIKKELIIDLLNSFNGLVVLDEAYIDFAPEVSFVNEIVSYPNLVVLQTFSKGRANAGIRLGMAFTNAEIVKILNKIKYPYNISQLSQKAALDALQTQNLKSNIDSILEQREWLENNFNSLKSVTKVWPSDANFLLVQFKNHKKVFNYLKEAKIIVRERSGEYNCDGCLRISVGTPIENKQLIESLKKYEQTKSNRYEEDIIS